MATLSVIRRWALREQLSIREIARRTGLSRNTVRKYLRAGVVEPRYGKRISPSKLDPYVDKLSGWLKSEATKSRKQRRTLKQMHADLVALGFDGSYNRVAASGQFWMRSPRLWSTFTCFGRRAGICVGCRSSELPLAKGR